MLAKSGGVEVNILLIADALSSLGQWDTRGDCGPGELEICEQTNIDARGAHRWLQHYHTSPVGQCSGYAIVRSGGVMAARC